MESSVYKIRKHFSSDELENLFNEMMSSEYRFEELCTLLSCSEFCDVSLDTLLYNSYKEATISYDKRSLGYFRTILFYTEYEDLPLYVVSPNITIAFVAKWRLKIGK